jgi:hypothetical protein
MRIPIGRHRAARQPNLRRSIMEHRGATNIHLLSVRNNASYVGLFLGDIANKQDTVELLPAFRVSILVGARDIGDRQPI